MNKVFFGDCRDSMRKLIADGVKVQTCVTSPPYFGLRDYGTATWEGGGDSQCDHIAPPTGGREKGSALSGTGNRGGFSGDGQYKHTCGKCGALRVDQQLGLEQTPQEYVANMVDVFGLVRELLNDDGTLWLNLGDSYGAVSNRNGSESSGLNSKRASDVPQKDIPKRDICTGLRPKNLLGIPWRVAFALQADGWYLRQDIIWHKPNPMPESVTDRCTKAHEYIFLLSKSERYYFDHEAIKEELQSNPTAKRLRGTEPSQSRAVNGQPQQAGVYSLDGKRNRRDVWTVSTKPYKGAHFATFPPDLITPCVLAGAPPDGIVLDPFLGSGTTAQVAQSLGRQWIGLELNPDYAELQNDRTAQMGMELA